MTDSGIIALLFQRHQNTWLRAVFWMNPEWGDFSFLKDNPGLLYFESTLYTENRVSIHSKPGSKSQVGPVSDVTGKLELWWLKKDGGGGRGQEEG